MYGAGDVAPPTIWNVTQIIDWNEVGLFKILVLTYSSRVPKFVLSKPFAINLPSAEKYWLNNNTLS